jgi:eukaryotic-like serine/threonine-protein kinase
MFNMDTRFELGSNLAANVLQVWNPDTQSNFAMKVPRRQVATAAGRLLYGARVQARCSHPNVVSVLEVVRVDELPALVMELVEGPSLREFMEMSTLNLGQLAELGSGIIDGVVAIHEMGLVHRNLTPDHVLIELDPRRVTPKITSFTLAKAVARPPTASHPATLGTPGYMPIEQIQNAADVDQRADVYALGAILYELVSGRRAHPRRNGCSLLDSANAQVPDVRDYRHDLPEFMADAIMQALEPRAINRPSSSAALRALWCGSAGQPGTSKSKKWYWPFG